MLLSHNSLYLKVAGLNFKFIFGDLKKKYLREIMIDNLIKYYRGFIISNKPRKIDYTFNFVENERIELIFHKKKRKYFTDFYRKKNNKQCEVYYYVSPFQFQWLFASVTSSLISDRGGFNLHASAVCHNNKIHLFLGNAGSGKSTILNYLKNTYSPIAEDTNSIIRKVGNVYVYYQGALIELPGIIFKSNKKYALGKFFFLKKTRVTKITKMKNRLEVRKILAKQIFTAKHLFIKQYQNMEFFLKSFDDFYRLDFRLDKKELADEVVKYI